MSKRCTCCSSGEKILHIYEPDPDYHTRGRFSWRDVRLTSRPVRTMCGEPLKGSPHIPIFQYNFVRRVIGFIFWYKMCDTCETAAVDKYPDALPMEPIRR